MARLVVYTRSSPCPDVYRWEHWLSQHQLELVEIDIDRDADGLKKVRAWTGHYSTPTLVIAPDDGIDPVRPPAPLPPGRGPRGVDRGTMLTEPFPGQVEVFLERNGIPFEKLPEPEPRKWFWQR